MDAISTNISVWSRRFGVPFSNGDYAAIATRLGMVLPSRATVLAIVAGNVFKDTVPAVDRLAVAKAAGLTARDVVYERSEDCVWTVAKKYLTEDLMKYQTLVGDFAFDARTLRKNEYDRLPIANRILAAAKVR